MSEIRFESVGHRYGDRIVLQDIDLALTEGKVGVVGANGSGKSTLARTINGLVTPTAGRVTVDGLSPAGHGREVRRKVGFVFTDPDTQIVMPTVAEDVAFSLRRSGLGKAEIARRVSEILCRMGLSDYADHPAHLLSGGQKQLLALAAVLVREPAVVVADEPTTLLDLRNARRIAAILATLPQQVIAVTHDLTLLETFDRVIVLDAGRVVADSAPGEALRQYRALCDDTGDDTRENTYDAAEPAHG
ncbi:MAG: cobalt ABC transporter ATP-binding protein [Actinobacteria bacterium 69-20]|jgi:biotin transport system ATP-binding protein|nr:ABC transporter ATP-binding protein [Actinomycetota bacterium]OJV28036.1 MAG: cobalt ABC transporter ATP-binding protein [Actinobacteria bacterium 69-20]